MRKIRNFENRIARMEAVILNGDKQQESGAEKFAKILRVREVFLSLKPETYSGENNETFMMPATQEHFEQLAELFPQIERDELADIVSRIIKLHNTLQADC